MSRIAIPKNQWRDFRRSVSHNIKVARQAKQISIEVLAEKTGYAVSTLERFENTYAQMRLYDLLHIAIALDVPPETLVANP